MTPKRAPFILAFSLFAVLSAGCTTPTAVPSDLNVSATDTSFPTAASSPSPASIAAETESVCPPFSSEILRQIQEIERQVSELRGISLQHAVASRIVNTDEIWEQIQADMHEKYTLSAAEDEFLVLRLLGVVDESFDPAAFFLSFYGEQIAGEYDPEEESIVMLCNSGFGGTERLTYVHTYTQVLQDQNFDFEAGLGYTQASCSEETDRCAAVEALIEGDAALLQSQWLRIFASAQDAEELTAFLNGFDTPVFDQAPLFIRSRLLFPYVEGMSFVLDAYLAGGWAGVDAIYAEPPVSTEQILHFERYPHDEPISLQKPDLVPILGAGWRTISAQSLGEFQLQSFLDTFLSETDAAMATEGWGGDLFLAYTNDETDLSAGVLLTQWDTIADAHEFFYSLKEYGQHRFGEETRAEAGFAQWVSDKGYILIRLVSNQILLLIAPDADTLTALDAVLTLPWGHEQ
ncbi:MAG: hypothetical protein JXA97_02375 [Anaerolineales bacterium]|nr:hypothetical protein [Anaerolineales bacterium]